MESFESRFASLAVRNAGSSMMFGQGQLFRCGKSWMRVWLMRCLSGLIKCGSVENLVNTLAKKSIWH